MPAKTPKSQKETKSKGSKSGPRATESSFDKTLLLTTPDLVLLSLLAERPMHGYQANVELERRQVRDWAAISRPQIYYSIEKLDRAGLVRKEENQEPSAGPERAVYATTQKGRRALADALERDSWTSARERPPFLTWLALSWQAKPGVFEQQLARRREFLQAELAREEATLKGIIDEVGHQHHEAVWMVSLIIQQMKAELDWLAKVESELGQRAPARATVTP